jgi:acetyl-CoA carboxylase biotin carboxyl carrier protein
MARMTDDARLGSLPGDEPLNHETAEVLVEPGSGDGAGPASEGPADPEAVPAPGTAADGELLALIDRLAVLLDHSDLSELEVEAGRTGLVLRKPVAVAPAGTGGAAVIAATDAVATVAAVDGGTAAAPARPAVTAPLTGIFYASPAPGSAPYVQVGGEVAVGQVIGLIEAMKLFNEIKSDLAGRVVKVVAESGALVKAKQPLIEVEPL